MTLLIFLYNLGFALSLSLKDLTGFTTLDEFALPILAKQYIFCYKWCLIKVAST